MFNQDSKLFSYGTHSIKSNLDGSQQVIYSLSNQVLSFKELCDRAKKPISVSDKSHSDFFIPTDCQSKKKKDLLKHDKFNGLVVDIDSPKRVKLNGKFVTLDKNEMAKLIDCHKNKMPHSYEFISWSLEEIKDRLAKYDINSYLIYATPSSSNDYYLQQLKRFRIVIPVFTSMDADTREVLQKALSLSFGADNTADKITQFQFMPVLTMQNKGVYFEDLFVAGGTFFNWKNSKLLDRAIALCDLEREKEKAKVCQKNNIPQQERQQGKTNCVGRTDHTPIDSKEIIDHVNACPIQSMGDYLISQGYTYQISNDRFLRPNAKQNSIAAGCIFAGGNGDPLYYSHSSNDLAVNEDKNNTSDMFQLIVNLSHDGNISDAIKQLSAEIQASELRNGASGTVTEYNRALKRKERKTRTIPVPVSSTADDDISNCINNFNQDYTHIVSNGANYVCRTGVNNVGENYFELFKLKEFRDAHLHLPKLKVEDEYGKIKYQHQADIWLGSQSKNFASNGITFYPVKERFVDGKLNSYFGLSIEPKSYDYEFIKPYLAHIKFVVCGGNQEHFEYVLNWLAHLFQRPHEKPDVALVLQSDQGTGKGLFVKPLGEMIGSHFAHLTDSSQVVGRFNSSIENKILIFADEFTTDKAGTNKIKSLISEKTAIIERKGIDCIQVPSFSRVIVASNDDHIFNVTLSDRRNLWLSVSDEHIGDHLYFDALFKLVADKNFQSQLLAYLLERDISNFKIHTLPVSEKLQSQKVDGLDPLNVWILDCLHKGAFTNNPAMKDKIPSTELSERFDDWLTLHKKNFPKNIPKALGHAFKKLRLHRMQVWVKNPDGSRSHKTWQYYIPDIEQLRETFNEVNGLNIEW